MSEIIYEPRALWSTKYVRASALDGTTPVPTVERFSKEHFRNGWQHPITLTHMLIAGVGYALQTYPGRTTVPTGDQDRHTCASAIQVCKVLVRSPGRQLFMLYDLLTGTFSPEPREDLTMAQLPEPYPSSMLGLSKWTFDKPLVLPPDYTVDFRLGGALLQPSDVSTDTQPPFVAAAFHETGVGTNVPGSSFRSNVRSSRASMPWRKAAGDGFSFPEDGLGGVQNPTTSTTKMWPWRFETSEYRRQIESQSGPTTLHGFTVAIDQTAFDDAVQDSVIANVAGQPVASLSLRTPTRCRIIDAGSQADWWRPGAPLALVCPTVSPAQVYELARPITLHKGDCLDVELEVPPGILVGEEEPLTIRPTYQVGVSFTGYAAVEGS